MILVIKKIINKLKKDISYTIILIVPLVLAILSRIIIPTIQNFNNYLIAFDILISVIIAIAVALVISLFIIEELTEEKPQKLLYTNNKINNYLNNRLFIALILITIYIFVIMLLLSLTKFRITDIIILSMLEAIVGVVLILVNISYAKSKEQVFKIMSLSTIFIFAAMLPFVVLTSKVFYFSIFPTLWISKYFYNYYPIYPAWSIMISLIWIVGFKIKFYLKYK